MSQPNDPNQPQQPGPPAQPSGPYAGGSRSAGPSPYGAAPQINPYGAGGQAFPGSKAYVEQHFGPVAGFGGRALALIIDSLLMLIGFIPMVIGAVLLVVAAPDTDAFGSSIDGTGSGGTAALGGILIVLGILLAIGIQVWNRIFRMGRTGQSVGKQVMGLKLVHEQTGQPIGALQAFLRELLSGLINQIFYLSYLWMLWDDNSQTLHDKVVHSTVIQLPKT